MTSILTLAARLFMAGMKATEHRWVNRVWALWLMLNFLRDTPVDPDRIVPHTLSQVYTPIIISVVVALFQFPATAHVRDTTGWKRIHRLLSRGERK